MNISSKIAQKFGRLVSIASILGMGALAGACGNDIIDDGIDVDATPQGGISVPITISLCTDWQIDESTESRYAPGSGNTGGWVVDDDELDDVKTVVIYTFRRRVSSDPNMPNLSKFALDDPNKIELTPGTLGDYTNDNPEHQGPSDSHKHRVFTGNVNLMEGYEYRVLAIAYSEKTQNFDFISKDVLSFTGHNLEDFVLTVNASTPFTYSGTEQRTAAISSNMTDTPQVFYGFCHPVGDDGDIINYDPTDFVAANTLKERGLTGILYRGVAKVELTITNTAFHNGIDYNTTSIALLADNIQTKCSLANYDGFNEAYQEFETDQNKFTIFAKVDKDAGKGEVTLTAYLLPTVTKLGLRAGTKYNTNNSYNALITPSDDIDLYTGTGILSPVVANNQFYFRRNHIYKLTLNNLSKVIEYKAAGNGANDFK